MSSNDAVVETGAGGLTTQLFAFTEPESSSLYKVSWVEKSPATHTAVTK